MACDHQWVLVESLTTLEGYTLTWECKVCGEKKETKKPRWW